MVAGSRWVLEARGRLIKDGGRYVKDRPKVRLAGGIDINQSTRVVAPMNQADVRLFLLNHGRAKRTAATCRSVGAPGLSRSTVGGRGSP